MPSLWSGRNFRQWFALRKTHHHARTLPGYRPSRQPPLSGEGIIECQNLPNSVRDMHTYNYHAHDEPLPSSEGGDRRRKPFNLFWSDSRHLLLRQAQLLSDFVAIGVYEGREWPSHQFFFASEFIPLNLGFRLIDCVFLFDGWPHGLNFRAA